MRVEHIAMYANDLEKAKRLFKYFRASAKDGCYNQNTDFRSYFSLFDAGARLEINNKSQMLDVAK